MVNNTMENESAAGGDYNSFVVSTIASSYLHGIHPYYTVFKYCCGMLLIKKTVCLVSIKYGSKTVMFITTKVQ